ncbi:hypothetical protein ACIA49_38680 [Kribbella sp. NPDC051587]|uniref:hypothetical protein n=1 Tax=Kribbella sp. NPDC051587 TaxID=3364119 RepID=UPI0037BADFDB
MANQEAVPESIEQMLKELLAARGAPVVKLEKAAHVSEHARGARPQKPVIYIDDKFLAARPDVQRFMLAHELARLQLGKPRLPGGRALAGAGALFTFLGPVLFVVIAAATGVDQLAWGGWSAIIVGVATLLGARRAQSNQLAADALAIEQHGEPESDVLITIWLMDPPRFMPQILDPVVSGVWRNVYKTAPPTAMWLRSALRGGQ